MSPWLIRVTKTILRGQEHAFQSIESGMRCASAGHEGAVLALDEAVRSVSIVPARTPSNRGTHREDGGRTQMIKSTLGTGLCLVALAFAPPQQGAPEGSTGTIHGRLVAKRARRLDQAVVYLETVGENRFPAPQEPALIDQRDLEFHPHVLPILKGTTVEFLNSDPLLHNVFSPDDVADKFNLGTWEQGDKRRFTFEKTGVAALLCKVHPEMEGFVVVLENPYFTMAEKDGSFTLPEVPPGTYTLHAWHPKYRQATIEVTVTPGETVEAEVPVKR